MSRRHRSPTGWRSTAALRSRPLWRTAVDAGGFILVLAVVMFTLDKAGVLDVGTGGYSVIDGDSLRRGTEEIRLFGIDAVEYTQNCIDANQKSFECGKLSAQSLRNLIRGKTVSCKAVDRDRYGRVVAICSNGTDDINLEQVKLGWAIAYRQHSWSYVDSEREARMAKRGIWAGSFEMPENYRRRAIRADSLADKDAD